MTMLAQNTFTVKRATKDGYSCSLSSYSVMLNADSNGIVNGLSAASTTVKLYQGSTAVTPVISIDSVSNCSAGISGLNVSIVSVPNNTKSGYVDIKIVYGSFVKIERYSFTVVDYTIVKSYTQSIVGDQMTSYATKDTVNVLSKTVLEQSTKIEQNSKDIALKASQLDVDNLGGRMKTAEAKITPDAINLTVKSQINTAVANVQIGGRNLLLNSKTSKSGTSYNIGLWTSSRDFIVGETLTVTIRGSISSSKLFGIWFNGGSYGGYPIPKVSDGIFSTVISVPSGTSNRTVGIYLISNQSASDSWTFEWIKLEWGNKATDWSPAPEDIDSKISLRPTTDEIKSSFSISTDGISMLGKKISLSGIVSFKSLSDYSDVNGRINDAQTTANNAKDSLETLTKSLSGLVSKSQIEQAMKEEGLISGGFLKMSLIDVKNVVAQGISAQTIDAGNATIKNLSVDTVKMTNADVSGKITAAEGTIGPFSISPSSLTATQQDGSSTYTLLLNANLVKFTGPTSAVLIGANVFPSSSGGFYNTPARYEITRTARADWGYGNIGIYISATGVLNFGDDNPNAGNNALYIADGCICGLRYKLRRVSTSQTLSKMDTYIITRNNSSTITLTLPHGCTDGQVFYMKSDHFTSGNYIIAAESGYGTQIYWTGNDGTQLTIKDSKEYKAVYDAVYNRWGLSISGY